MKNYYITMERFFIDADEKTKPLHRVDVVFADVKVEIGVKLSGNMYRFIDGEYVGVLPMITPVEVQYYELVDRGMFYVPAGKNKSFSSYLVVNPVYACGQISKKIDENLGYEVLLSAKRPVVGEELKCVALKFAHSGKFQMLKVKEVGTVREVLYFGANLAYVLTEGSDMKYVVSYDVD